MFLGSNADSSISIVVYPKLWNSSMGVRRVKWDSTTRHLAVAIAEGEVLEIEADADRLAILDSECKRIRKGCPRLVVPFTGDDEVELMEWGSEVDPVLCLQGIEQLMTKVGHGSLIKSLGSLSLPQLSVPLLRPFLYLNFVEEFERLIRDARRDYRWVSEDSVGVHGRPDEVALEISRSTGWPVVKCLFQNFDRVTDVLTAVCAALEVVANDGQVGMSEMMSVADLRLRAIRLRRMLLDVPTVTRLQGLDALGRARLGHIRSEWQSVLEFTEGVLIPDAGISFGEGSLAVEVGVDTSRVWELILALLLRRAGCCVIDGNSDEVADIIVKRPWLDLGVNPPRPDLLVRVSDSWLILDGKYKKNHGSPAIGDLYQLFAYSHLSEAKDTSIVESVGLVFPVSESVALGTSGPYFRNPAADLALFVYRVPFPSLSDCVRTWNQYVETGSASFRIQLETTAVA